MTSTETVQQVLQDAATLIRERAYAATPGPWTQNVLGSEGYEVRAPAVAPQGSRIPRRLRVARCGYEAWETDKANAEHIAAWQPEAALKIADWLDVTATDVGTSTLAFHAALAFARTYLGREA